MVSFTGSTAGRPGDHGGRQRHGEAVFLELGGKSAFDRARRRRLDIAALFCAFATLALRSGLRDHVAAAGAARRTTTRSSRCCKNNFGVVTLRRPHRRGHHMGPLISEQQRDKVAGMVERAVADGADAGHRRRARSSPGFFYRADAARRRRPGQRDRPGRALRSGARRDPATTDDDDAVRIANNSIFGLSGAVFGSRGPRARGRPPHPHRHDVRQRRHVLRPRRPFGGYKQSGIGREMGAAGLEEFLERRRSLWLFRSRVHEPAP